MTSSIPLPAGSFHGLFIWDRTINTRFAISLKEYLDAKSGKRLVFAVYANNVPISSLDDAMDVGEDLGSIAGLIYENY